MKKIKFLLLGTVLMYTYALHAQTVDEIINKHIEALGGKEKLSQVKSLYTESSVEVMGNAAPAKEYLVEGKGFKSESEFNGMKIINCYTDKSGWSLNPFTGSNDPQAMPDDLYKAGKNQIFIGGSLTDYAAKGNKVEFIGKEGKNYKLKVTSGGIETFYFIDAETNLVIKTTQKADFGGQPVEIVVSFSDYKKTDFGIMVPYTKGTDFGGFALEAKVTKVEVNKEIDPKTFEMSK
jgi:hypothetical protein